MKRILFLLLIVFATAVKAASFNAGDIVVERVGDGVLGLSSSATVINLLEYTTAGSLVQNITLPSANPAPNSTPFNATEAGSATSDGFLNLSSNGQVLTVPGYNAALGTANVVDTSGTTVSRTIAVILSSATVDTTTSVNMLSGSNNNYRSVVSDTGSRFWGAGVSGVVYVNSLGATGTNGVTSILGSSANARNIKIYNGSLFESTGSVALGGQRGIYKLGSGLPTTALSSANVSLVVATGSSSSPYGFILFDTNNDAILDTAFIADDRSSTGGGISRYDFDGTNWIQKYSLLLSTSVTGNLGTLSSGAPGLGLRDLTGNYNGTTGSFSLFATTASTSNNALISVTDLGNDSGVGYAAPANYTLLATSGSNTGFRGVDFAPAAAVPEPDTWAPLSIGMVLIGVSYQGRKARYARAAVRFS